MTTKPMTMATLRAIIKESGISHARDCVEQNATQVGSEKVEHLIGELDRLTWAEKD